MVMKFGKIKLEKGTYAYYYPTDRQLQIDTGGKYFITYAEETKIQTFTNKRDAESFISLLKKQATTDKQPYQFAYGTVWANSKKEALKELKKTMKNDQKRSIRNIDAETDLINDIEEELGHPRSDR